MGDAVLSRRQFGLMTGVALAGAGKGLAQSGLTAQQVIERIQKNVGVPWRTPTVDTFKAGDPATAVKGIAVTFMATLDVLQRAVAAGMNLVVTHEPSFYNHPDNTSHLTEDPIYRFKREFIAKNDLVLWRFHDHWHMRKPDPVLLALAQLLGWDKYQDRADQRYYTPPKTTLADLASTTQRRLKVKAMRVIGDPSIEVSKLAVIPGAAGPGAEFASLPHADVYVCGEATEWEGIEYARDTIASGQKKGMILLGHQASEEPGMEACATWLKTFVSEVPIQWIPTGDAFWSPA
jgi:putative NIF3 family GTP cyclohydrolase 1 type 2